MFEDGFETSHCCTRAYLQRVFPDVEFISRKCCYDESPYADGMCMTILNPGDVYEPRECPLSPLQKEVNFFLTLGAAMWIFLIASSVFSRVVCKTSIGARARESE